MTDFYVFLNILDLLPSSHRYETLLSFLSSSYHGTFSALYDLLELTLYKYFFMPHGSSIFHLEPSLGRGHVSLLTAYSLTLLSYFFTEFVPCFTEYADQRASMSVL